MAKLVKGDKFPDFTVDTHMKKGVKISQIVGRQADSIACYPLHRLYSMSLRRTPDSRKLSEVCRSGLECCGSYAVTAENVNKDLNGQRNFAIPNRM